jgi:tetratricopeptide (TPR) repeat protein
MLLALALLLAAAPSTFPDIAKQATAAREANRVDDAIRLYREGVRTNPSWAEGWWYLGTLYYDANKFPAAKEALRRFVKLQPDAAPGWAMLGLSEFETKDYKGSLAHLERGLNHGLNEGDVANVARYHAALLLTHSGQFEMALKTLNDLAARGVDNADTILAFGLASLRVPALPTDLATAKRPMVEEVGRVMFDAGARRGEAAQAGFKRLAAEYPDEPEIHYLYGTFLANNDPDQAIDEWKRELQISPNHVPARVQLALEYLKRGDAETALPYAREAIKLEPGAFATHYALGRVLVGSGNVPEGIHELEKARELAPDSPETRVALASAYAKAGRSQDAARERGQFQKLQQQRDKR